LSEILGTDRPIGRASGKGGKSERTAMAQRIRGEPVVQRKGGAIGDRDEGKAGARNGEK
jgi:hypothetical protein